MSLNGQYSTVKKGQHNVTKKVNIVQPQKGQYSIVTKWSVCYSVTKNNGLRDPLTRPFPAFQCSEEEEEESKAHTSPINI